MNTDIILSGVGGQGILSIATIIGAAAIKEKLYIKQAEVHGMSQRGGDVQSNLRISSDPISSDLIPLGKADLIIANIIADIVIRLFDELDAHLAEGGHLLASGIIDERVADVTEAALSHGFAIDKVIEESGWAAMVISRGDAQ